MPGNHAMHGVNPSLQADAGEKVPVRGSQIWLVALLMMTVILAFADRSLLSIMVEPIKKDLGIGDVQMSLLMGFAFSTVYCLAALPMGALVDVTNRRRLLAGAVVVWSAMTILCGFADSFWEMFVGRMGLGIAEAVVSPIAFSLIRDAFVPSQRGRAFAAFNASHLLGTGTALFVGGTLLGLAMKGGLSHLPLAAGLHPWQQVLVTLGFAGFPIALLILTMREPGRRGVVAGAPTPGFGETFRFIGQHLPLMIPFWIAVALFGLAQGGLTGWAATAIHRTWDVPLPMIGKTLGPIQIAIAICGAVSVGTIVDLIRKRGVRDSALVVAAISLGFSSLAAFSQLFIGSIQSAAVVYCLQLLFFAANSVGSSTALSMIAPPGLAGKLQAITGVWTSLVGLASGATVVALVSKSMVGPTALHDGLAIVVGTSIGTGALMFVLVSRAFRRKEGPYQGE
jgi:MFS family permease